MKHFLSTDIRLGLFLSAAIVMWMTASNASGQTSANGFSSRENGARVTPYQQRLSPYLDLLRNDNSVLSPYHSFVQPRRQIYQSQNTQAQQLQRIQRSIQQPARRSPQLERMQTGRGGTFNNYLHYYNFNSSGLH